LQLDHNKSTTTTTNIQLSAAARQVRRRGRTRTTELLRNKALCTLRTEATTETSPKFGEFPEFSFHKREFPAVFLPSSLPTIDETKPKFLEIAPMPHLLW
jgi:hypothetical protein